MSEFKNYHPAVNLLYFACVIVFAMCFMHPACLFIAVISSVCCSVILNGRKAVRLGLFALLPMIIVTALINPAFNHAGVTILLYLPNGNPLTMESIIYGIAAAAMLAAVICWFSCFNKIMTSDKIVYLFGKLTPALSLMLSMTLRFVPRFKTRAAAIARAQRCVGRDISQGSVLKRAKNGMAILSALITWALENSIETANSMKSRGFGLPGRSAFSIFDFDKRDIKAAVCIILLTIYIIIGARRGCMYSSYFPSVKTARATVFSVSVFIAYFALCMIPSAIEITERIKWNVIKSKI